ncbi:MAG: hypothetical protein AAGE94_04690 [Acidobacteriota bacterium]
MKSRWTALAFVVALTLSFVPAQADQQPVDLGLLPMLGYEMPEWMAPTDGIVFTGPSWCTNRTNQYCTYAWDFASACCYATWIQPGAWCPSICY